MAHELTCRCAFAENSVIDRTVFNVHIGNHHGDRRSGIHSTPEQDNLEVRQYEPQILAGTIVDTEFEDAGSEAFGRLFKYISGNNQSQQEIAMTAPVGQVAEGQEIDMTAPVGQTQVDGKWVVSFMMPSSFTMDSIPKPNDERIALRSVPKQTMAAIPYSGFWN